MENKYKIESVLFASGVPMSLEELQKICELSEYETNQGVSDLISEYQEKQSGLQF